MIEEFALVDPRLDGRTLLVSGALRHCTKCFERIAACVHFCLQFDNFVSTRWCGVGIAMRLYMRGRCMGLQLLIDI